MILINIKLEDNFLKNIFYFDFDLLKNECDFGIPKDAKLENFSVDGDGVFKVIYEVPENELEDIFEDNSDFDDEPCLGCYLESLENRISELEDMIKYLVDEIEEINDCDYDELFGENFENESDELNECDCCGEDVFINFNDCIFNITIGE